MTSEALPRSISLPAAGSGPSPQGKPDGPTAALSGPPRARASRSAGPGKDAVLMTQGTCGPTWIDSSMNAAPQGSDLLSLWESRLRERLATIGSTESELIWRSKDTGLGWSISRLAPWTPPISARGSIGSPWPTAQARDGMPPHSPEYVAKHKANGHGMANLNDYMAFSATWPTPDASLGGPDPETRTTGLSTQTYMARAQWPSPQAMDGNKGSLGPRSHDTGVSLPQRMAASMGQWPTPTVADAKGGHLSRGGKRSNEMLLKGMMKEAQWSTPQARCGKGSRTPNGSKHVRPGGQMLNEQIVETADAMDHSGPMPNGSSATTAKRGAPNPVFACWLMGFPDAWISGALRAMQSWSPKRAKSSPR